MGLRDRTSILRLARFAGARRYVGSPRCRQRSARYAVARPRHAPRQPVVLVARRRVSLVLRLPVGPGHLDTSAFGLPAGVPVSIFWQVALFAFVVLAGRMPWLRAALSAPALFEIGVASYSIYLVHQPLVALVAAPVASRIANPWFAVFITSTIGVVGGLLFWYAVERVVTTAHAKAWLEALVKPLLDRAFDALRLPRRISFALPVTSAVGTGAPPRLPRLEDTGSALSQTVARE